jgi:hypothetical protein
MASAARSTQLAGFAVVVRGGGATVGLWVALCEGLGEALFDAVALWLADADAEVVGAAGEVVEDDSLFPSPHAETVISRPSAAAATCAERAGASRRRAPAGGGAAEAARAAGAAGAAARAVAAGTVGWERTAESHTSSSADRGRELWGCSPSSFPVGLLTSRGAGRNPRDGVSMPRTAQFRIFARAVR